MAWLTLGTQTRELRDGELVVGSGADADWRISTADLLPRHFVVSMRAGQSHVRTATAESVVVVNSEQLVGAAPRALADGDAILAGSGRFAFSESAPTLIAADDPRQTPQTSQVAHATAFLVDDQAKVAHPLTNRSTPIGRDASNAIVVRDPTASRFHAEVRREAGGFALHSMGAGGTIVNGKSVTAPCLLGEGDVLEIAFTTLRFTREAPAVGIALASPSTAPGDDVTRKPTLGSERIVVDESNEAGRHARKVQAAIALLIAALVVWWLVR